MLICLVAWTVASAVARISGQSMGYSPERVTALEIGPVTRNAAVTFTSGGEGEFPFAAFTRATLSDARESFPGLASISAASCAPFGQAMKVVRVQSLEGNAGPAKFLHFCGVSQSYFATMGNAIVRGRGFSPDAFTDRVSEVIVNRQLARELWASKDPSGSALESTLRVEEPNFDLHFTGRVVGVAEDMRFGAVESTPEATVFLPLRENVFALSFPLYFLVKGSEPQQGLSRYVQQQASVFMPAVGVIEAYGIEDRLRSSRLEQRARLYLPVGGAFVVACIAYLGLYGSLLYAASLRRKELAIRVCFGASRWQLRRTILGPAIASAAVAGVAALLGWRLLLGWAGGLGADWLGGSDPSWQSMLAVPAVCAILAVGTALGPARSVAKLSPGEILKEF